MAGKVMKQLKIRAKTGAMHPDARPRSGRMRQSQQHRSKALVLTVDEQDFPFALFCAQRAAQLSQPCDFDILICSFEPLEIPPAFAELGIRNLVLDLRDEMEAHDLPLYWLPLVTYMRLWLPGKLAAKYDRLLYTDADTMLATSELSRLFDVDMGSHSVAAVSDKMQWLALDRPVIDFEALNIDCGKYLNAGVCLFDVARYNKAGLLPRMLEIHHRGTPLAHHDQSLLNLALEGQWAELSPAWNWQWANAYPWFTARFAPKILHFGGPAKPWKAATIATRYPAEIIATYERFLDRHQLPCRFSAGAAGGRRYGALLQMVNLAEHLWALPACHKLVARYPDPWKTRL